MYRVVLTSLILQLCAYAIFSNAFVSAALHTVITTRTIAHYPILVTLYVLSWKPQIERLEAWELSQSSRSPLGPIFGVHRGPRCTNSGGHGGAGR